MPALKPPLHTQVSRDPQGRWQAVWRRKKLWPERAPWKRGFAPCFSPSEVALGASQAQVLPVFTRAFEPPEDQLHGLVWTQLSVFVRMAGVSPRTPTRVHASSEQMASTRFN